MMEAQSHPRLLCAQNTDQDYSVLKEERQDEILSCEKQRSDVMKGI